MTEETSARRKPKQARSQQRVDHLIDTAAALFAEKGYDAVTTNAIAERAGMSIGSLYQFFPNKEALLDGLAERYVDDMRGQMRQIFSEEMAALPLTQVIDTLIDELAAFDISHAGFEVIFLSNSLSLQASSAVNDMHREMVGAVDNMIAARFPALNPQRRRVAAMVGVGIVKGLMPLAQPPDNLPAPQVLAEVKATILAYMRSLLVREGHALPPDLA